MIQLARLALLYSVLASLSGFGCGHSASSPDAGPDDVFEVDFTTSKGAFVAEVHRSWAPHGAARFRDLVEAGFYDDARFFRVVPGFVAQFGINGTPATDARWSNQTIPDDPVVVSNTRGYLTFAATSSADSRTTQLFVNFGDNHFLDPMRFAPFALVTSGMDVVDRLESKYGEDPDQAQISAQGTAYLTAGFPDLDFIVHAKVR